MKTRLKNVLIYVSIVLILIISFGIPNILFNIEDYKTLNLVFRKEKTIGKIDVQAKNIYIVKAIHDIQDKHLNVKIGNIIKSTNSYQKIETNSLISYSEVYTFNNDITVKKIIDEISKLKNNEIINKMPIIDEENKCVFNIIDKKYQSYKIEYILNIVTIDSEEFKAKLEIEEKTGKIITMAYLDDIINHNLDKETILRNYVKYLDLYVIDDWKFQNDVLESEKAKIMLKLETSNNESVISINSNGREL